MSLRYRMIPAITSVVALALFASPIHAQSQNLFTNPGFEGTYFNGVAPGWEDNSYGSFTVRYSEDKANPHSSEACQKVECLSFASGSGIQFMQPVSYDPSKAYTISVWMRAEGLKQPVMIVLRRGPSPYDHWLHKWVTVTSQWRRYTLIGQPSGADSADNRFMIHFRGTGTLWVDDASMVEGSFAEGFDSAQPADSSSSGVETNTGPNILPNGGFEIGWQGWAPIDRNRPGIFIDRTTAAEGWCSLRARVNPTRISLDEMERTVTSLYLPIGSETKNYILSLWMKSDEDDAQVRFGFYSAGPSIEKTVTMGKEWKRYSVTGPVGGPESRKGGGWVAVTGASGPVNVWLDGVQVQEGSESKYGPKSAVEVAGYPTRPDCTYLESEGVFIDIYSSVSANRLKWTYRVEDYHGNLVKVGIKPVDAPNLPANAHRIKIITNRLGIFRLLATASDGKTSGTTDTVFLRVAKPPATSKLGCHAGAGLFIPTGQPIIAGMGRFKEFAPFVPDLMARLGAKWWRMHDGANSVLDWWLVENKKGEFNWYDGVIDGLRSRGFNILGMITRTPDWAARNPQDNRNGRSVPRDYAYFGNYVTKLDEHYKGRIKHWELWNTPGDPGFWAGTPEEYVELLKVGSRALKSVDAENKVLTVWLGYERENQATNERLLQAGMTDYLDIFGFHGYGGESAISNVEEFRKVVDRYGGMKPMWETEAGIFCKTFRKSYFDGAEAAGVQWTEPQDYRLATESWVRSVATSFAAGSQKYFFYWVSPTGLPSQQYGSPNMIDFDGTPQPIAAAYSALGKWLSEATPFETINLGDRVRALVFQRKEGALAVIYGRGMPGRTGVTLTIPIASSRLKLVDMMGNIRPLKKGTQTILSVSSEPVYLLAPGISPKNMFTRLIMSQRKGELIPFRLLAKLNNYGLDESADLYLSYTYKASIGKDDLNAYSFANSKDTLTILWYGDPRGKVTTVPRAKVTLSVPASAVTTTDALGRTVEIGGADKAEITVDVVPVFVKGKGQAAVTNVEQLPR